MQLSLILLAIELNPLIKQYAWLIVLVGCVLLVLGIAIGYILGNTSLKKYFYKELEESEHQGAIQMSITENVGMGIVVYDSNGPVFTNKAAKELRAFFKNGIPRNIDVFLETYDKENHLKSDYLLSVENGIDVIRANYHVDNRVFEIKILRKTIEYSDIERDDESSSEKLHIILIEDITQIKDDERRQKDLAANVSHELKTPLTVIRASEDFVKKINKGKVPTGDELKNWANRILNNAIRMQDIVEDFLVLSNNGESKRMGTFDIYKVVEKSIANLKDYPHAEGVRIVEPKRDLYPLCFGNNKLIVRIVTNLLTNAAKYIRYEGKTNPHEISIHIITASDKVGIQVTDNGRGIPQKDIDHLFERFYRVDNSGSRDVGGSGLGLAIAKEMADMHDGTITVNSKIGEGSTFTLFLPKATASFELVHEDAKAGVVSDVEYYKNVLRYILLEISEFAYSKKIAAITEFANEINIEDIDKVSDSDKIKLINMMDDTQYAKLVEDLTEVLPYEDEDTYEDEDDYEDYDEEDLRDDNPSVNSSELIENTDPNEAEFDQEAQFYAQEVLEIFEAEQKAREEADRIEREQREKEEIERQKKREAQEFLMQPVIQQSVKQGVKQSVKTEKTQTSLTQSRQEDESGVNLTTLEQKDVVHIHPNSDKKMYNGKGVKLFETKSKSKTDKKTSKEPEADKAEPIKSAVKLVLDEATASDGKSNKNGDTEGKE